LSSPAQLFIKGPVFDRFFFIYSPLIAAALPFLLDQSDFLMTEVRLGPGLQPRLGIFLGTFVYAHLILVMFRSHANPTIFKLYPYRFTVVPVSLFLCMLGSVWIAISVSVLVTWWDVYHSGLQTFGLGRIYDARAGNDPLEGRKLDYLLNLLLYAGPILGGAALLEHVGDFNEFEAVGSVFFTSIPAYAQSNAQYLTWAMLSIGVPFLVYYVYAHWRLEQKGYRVSRHKVALYTSTGICSIYAWGFNPFGHAFFVMNFFHALQYFAIVWITDKESVRRLFRLQDVPAGTTISFALFLALPFAIGYWGEVYAYSNTEVILWHVIAIMHFWYDGFIWSVRKKQV